MIDIQNTHFVRYFSHTVQLTVNDILKDKKKIGGILNIVSNLCNSIRKSCIKMYQIYECHLSTPVMRCDTRWSSDLKMLERLVENN
ncbi:hypothetical protein A3Q56_08562 [Intoshia linei]|uniref:Uncharacterized protein n=1 Tax=Intoshia linei TaxID=1819745 RepID=A0A177AQS0_9BILA|nr:hypothetical protein A3Q56_08562 [Intoshia linei]